MHVHRIGPRRAAIVFAGLLVATPGAARAADEPDYDHLGKALKEGKLAVNLRYRFEDVSDDTPPVAAKDAHASTLRTTLSYRTAGFHGFGAFVELEDVTDLGLARQHNNAGAGSLANGVVDRPVIADPAGTEVNQVYLFYRGWPKTTIRAGRQALVLDDQRFVGPVGWRQNQQSFDAVSLVQESVPRTKLTYAWVDNVFRVFGDNKRMSTHLLDVEITLGGSGRLAPYVYALDYDSAADAALSTTTYGVRWADERDCGGGWSLPYHVQIARQRDAGNNPLEVDAGYLRAEVGGARAGWRIEAGYELLEGSPADGAFTTPLATLHAFNGWADRFLSTPANGLADLYFSGSWTRGGVSARLAYHDFSSDTGSVAYGTEIDAEVTYKTSWNQVFAAAIARYDADLFASDTNKLWVWSSYSF